MKKIAYANSDGSVVVVGPAPGARLAFAVVLSNGDKKISLVPKPVDSFYRHWPIAGAVVEWAETEDQFLERLKGKDVPDEARSVVTIEDSSLPDRTNRNGWRLVNGVVVDPSAAKADGS